MEFSVIMPVYNGETYLKKSIKSILSQTFKHFEFIIINDGSTDRTKEILESIRDQRVTVYHLEKNHGQTYCLNFAISKACGDWIVRQDADDISHPRRLELQYKYLKSHPYLAGLGTLIKSIPGEIPVPLTELRAKEWSNQALTSDQIREFRFVAPPVIHGSMVFSKTIFEQIGGYNEQFNIGQDFDLWIRMLEVGTIEKVPKVLYSYRVDANSLSNKKETATCQESLLIASSHINKFLLKKYNRTPRLGLIGPVSGCQYFVEQFIQFDVVCQSNIDEDSNYPEVHQAIQNNKIDAVFVLDGGFSYEVIDSLKSVGLTINEDFFRLWNIF